MISSPSEPVSRQVASSHVSSGEIGADELRQAMFAYPTGASDVAAMLS
jgi:hypothetical protein